MLGMTHVLPWCVIHFESFYAVESYYAVHVYEPADFAIETRTLVTQYFEHNHGLAVSA
jgi:hypothetical protein